MFVCVCGGGGGGIQILYLPFGSITIFIRIFNLILLPLFEKKVQFSNKLMAV